MCKQRSLRINMRISLNIMCKQRNLRVNMHSSLNIIKVYVIEERANLSAFRTFVRFALVWFRLFPHPFVVWEGLRFVIMALPAFSLTFFMT